jgi:hypothetical protein
VSEAFTFRPPERRRGLRLGIGIPLTVLVLGLTVWVTALLWLPRTIHYEVGDGRLAVTSGWTILPRTRAIDLSAIRSARPVELSGGRRTAGTSLPGYCTGRFRFDGLGSVHLVGNCGRHAVVLDIEGQPRPWVLTPGDPRAFLAALAGEARYDSELRMPPASIGWTAVRAGLLLLMLLTLMVPLMFFVAPARLRYRVVPGHLEIDTVFGTRRFSLDTCLVRGYRPESSAKIIGSSMPGFHSGRFSVDGMTTRVHATHFDEGVLIEGPDLRLFITPSEPHAAIEVLRGLGGAA